MYQPQRQITNNIVNNESVFDPPRIALLNEKQWRYIQRRYHMSPRELQVARLVCRGFNNDQIAEALRIRNGTVKTHLRNIYRRVRIRSKITLLLRFVEDTNGFHLQHNLASPPISGSQKNPESTSFPGPTKGDTPT